LRAWSIIVTPRAFTATPFTQPPPTITCPASISAMTPGVGSTCTTVTFSPTATDGCSTPTVVCTPASGSCFAVGTTTVTCTATGTGGSSMCSFSVSVFNVRLQDDSNPAISFVGDSVSGNYRFCCSGTTYAGKASVTRAGNTVTFLHNAATWKLQAQIDGSLFRGTASLQSPPGTTKCTITDRDTRNDTS